MKEKSYEWNSTLDAREFERRFAELLRGGDVPENTGCVECAGCRACTRCTFCRHSERLMRCHYCVDCEQCTDSAHCRQGRGLLGCQHCLGCDSCSFSSYLTRCRACTSCTYCFGCVGLSGRDFCILNQPFERDAYFAITRRLEKELQLVR
jgi:hypothetical protein